MTSVSIATAAVPVNKTLVRMLSTGDLSPFDQWTNRSLRSGTVRLDCGLRFVCDENLYDARCSTYCRARNDALGHYDCHEATGARVCVDGWTGADSYCVTGKSISHPDGRGYGMGGGSWSQPTPIASFTGVNQSGLNLRGSLDPR